MAQEVTTAGRLSFALPFSVDPAQFSMHAWVSLVTTGGAARINALRASETDKNMWVERGNTTFNCRRSNPFTFGNRDVTGLASGVDVWSAIGGDIRGTDSECWHDNTQYTGVTSGVNNISSSGGAMQEFLVSGTAFSSAYGNDLQCRYAMVALWLGISLDDAEWAALAKGVNPRKIRPASLQLHMPFVRSQDCIFRQVLTPTNTGGAFAAVPGPRQFGGII